MEHSKVSSSPQEVLHRALQDGRLAPELRDAARDALGLTSKRDLEEREQRSRDEQLIRAADGVVTISAASLRELLDIAQTASWLVNGIVETRHLPADARAALVRCGMLETARGVQRRG
jgi:hypothetical protein